MDNQMNGNTRQPSNHEVIIAILHTIEIAIKAIRDVRISSNLLEVQKNYSTINQRNS